MLPEEKRLIDAGWRYAHAALAYQGLKIIRDDPNSTTKERDSIMNKIIPYSRELKVSLDELLDSTFELRKT